MTLVTNSAGRFGSILVLCTVTLAATLARAQTPKDFDIVTVPTHPQSNMLVFSPDGRRAVSAGGHTLTLWDLAAGRPLRTFFGHSGSVNAVAFSPDGRRIASASEDGTLRLWAPDSGREVLTFENLNCGTGWEAIAFSRDGRTLAAGGCYVTIFDAVSGRKIPDASERMSRKDKDYVRSLFESTLRDMGSTKAIAFAPNGTALFVGKNDDIRRYNLPGLHSLHTLASKTGRIRSLSLSPDETRVASGSEDKTVRIWDARTGQLMRTFEGHTDEVRSVAFSSDSRMILSSDSKNIILWNAATGQPVRAIDGYAGALSPDGKRVLTWSNDRLHLWEVSQDAPILKFGAGESAGVGRLAISSDGSRLLSASFDKKLKLWDPATGRLLRILGTQSEMTWSVALSPVDQTALTVDKNTLRLWDTGIGQAIRTIDAHEGRVRTAAFSSDGKRIVSGGDDKTIKLWEASTGRLLRTFEGHTEEVRAVTISADGARMASVGDLFDTNVHVRLWDVESGRLLRTLDGRRMRTSKERDAATEAWRKAGKQVPRGAYNFENLLRPSEGHGNTVWSIALSGDGSQLLTGSIDETAKLWDVASGRVLQTFFGHTRTVHATSFSRDRSRVLTASADGTAKLWEAQSGRLLRTFVGHSAGVNAAIFAPSGQRVITGSTDSTIRIWDSATGALVATSISNAEGDWLTITPEGFFVASEKGAGLLSVSRGYEVFGIDQFYQVLYRPDLVKEKLAGDPEGKVRTAAANLDLAKVLDSGMAPRVAMVSHKSGETSPTDLVTVEATVTNQGGGTGRAEWRINGVTVGIVEKINVALTQSVSLKQSFALDPGENLIEFVAYNGPNLIAAAPAQIKLTWTGADPAVPPRLHVVVIGINEYWDAKLRLNYAVPDAKALAAALKVAGRNHFEDVFVTEVLDAQATANNIDTVFSSLAQTIRSRDVFVLFAAGHGVTQEGRYFFIPQDFKYDTAKSYAERGIGQGQLQAWLARVPAKKSLVIFDTCESGTLAGVQLAALRGGLEQLTAVGRLIQATGRTTLAASLDNEPALEGYHGHGVFTYALLDALARGDRNGDGFVSVTELIEHVDALVPEITFKTWGARQVPRSLFQGSNFAIARQMPSVAPARGQEAAIPLKPTHINPQAMQVFKEPGGSGGALRDLGAFTTVTVVRTEQGWVFIAKDGRPLGYVRDGQLQKLN